MNATNGSRSNVSIESSSHFARRRQTAASGIAYILTIFSRLKQPKMSAQASGYTAGGSSIILTGDYRSTGGKRQNRDERTMEIKGEVQARQMPPTIPLCLLVAGG
jgi:hypothetical protein